MSLSSFSFHKGIYYGLTLLAGGVCIAGLFNTQLVLVDLSRDGGPGLIRWELLLSGWGALVYVIGCLTLASVSDRLGRRPCLTISSGVLTTAFCLLGWKWLGEYRVWHFFLAWGVANLAFSVFFTGMEGILSEYQDARVPLARRLGAYCMAWCAGNVLAAFYTGHTKQHFGPEVAYRWLGAACLVMTLVMAWEWLHLGNRKFGESVGDEVTLFPLAPFHARLGRIGIFFGCLAFSALMAGLPRYARDFHELAEGRIGDLLGILLFVAFCIFLTFPFWKGWQYRPGLQVALQAPMLAGLLLAFAAPAGATLLLALGFSLFGLGWGICYLFSIYYSLMVPADHARNGGLHEAFLGSGNFLGPILALGFIRLADGLELLPSARVGAMALGVGIGAIVLSLALQGWMIRRVDAPRSPASHSNSSRRHA